MYSIADVLEKTGMQQTCIGKCSQEKSGIVLEIIEC